MEVTRHVCHQASSPSQVNKTVLVIASRWLATYTNGIFHVIQLGSDVPWCVGYGHAWMPN